VFLPRKWCSVGDYDLPLTMTSAFLHHATDWFDRRASAVAGQQSWNQSPVTKQAAPTRRPDCFNEHRKRFCYMSDVQLTSPMIGTVLSEEELYSKVYYIHIRFVQVFALGFSRDETGSKLYCCRFYVTLKSHTYLSSKKNKFPRVAFW